MGRKVAIGSDECVAADLDWCKSLSFCATRAASVVLPVVGTHAVSDKHKKKCVQYEIAVPEPGMPLTAIR